MRHDRVIRLGGALALLLALAGCAGTGGTGTSLDGQLNELLARASSSLGGIMGADEATGAHHALMEVDAELGDLVQRAAQASPEIQEQLAATRSSPSC